MGESKPHSRVWFSPHGTEWEAETYEEALEMERDSLLEQLETLREALETISENEGATFSGGVARVALSATEITGDGSGEALETNRGEK